MPDAGRFDPTLLKTHANFRGSGRRQLTAAVQTTGAAVATLFSFALEDASVYWFQIRVVARDEAAAKRAVYHRTAMFHREGGGATLGGAGVQADFTDETTPAWNATLDVSGNDVRVRVTGEAAVTINWAVAVELQRVSGAP